MSISRLMQMGAAAPTGPEGAWDLSYAYYDDPNAWDFSSSRNNNVTFLVAAQESVPQGVSFKPDGTKMYMIGTSGDDVNEYNLSEPWHVPSASYLQNFSVSAQELDPQDLFFKPDGTKMYIIGISSDAVHEYDLSTAWDVSSASYLQVFSVAAQDTQPTGIFFKPDGTKMYVTGTIGDDVNEYNLSVAWDVSSASFLQNFGIVAAGVDPSALSFKPDGTKMYVLSDGSADTLFEYSLSIAWDISSAVYQRAFFAPSGGPVGLFFREDGLGFYILDRNVDSVFQLTMGGFSVAAQETVPSDVFFKPDGTKMYITGTTGDDVNEYDLSTAWDLSTASFLQLFSVAAQEASPQGLFFKPDGTKMYVLGATGDDVNEYDLSTAWDVSSASFLQLFSVAAQDPVPTSVFFKHDGTKMYVLGSSADNVNEYDLSTAWDVSSATYLQSFSVGTEEPSANALFFKPDGTKMYVAGVLNDNVNEYDLSTAWDVSTATFLQNFSVAAQEVSPTGLFFKDDGTQMFIVGNFSDRIFSYTLGPQ